MEQYDQEPPKVEGQMILEGMKQYLLEYDEKMLQQEFERDDFMDEPN